MYIWTVRMHANRDTSCDAEDLLVLGKTPFFMNMEREKVGIIHKIAKVDRANSTSQPV